MLGCHLVRDSPRSPSMNASTNDADSAVGGAAPTVDATTARLSSPASTGGAGTTFEQHVGAYWLAQLLVGAIPPIAIDSTVAEVSFQTERVGWHTDDFLVVGTSGGVSRNLPGQVKRSFTVSTSDRNCVQTVTDFWRDFNASHFSKDHDRLVLVTLRGTNTLLDHFVGLLDCARAARDGVEFDQRLATRGFISGTAVRYCGELQKIIGDIEEKPVTAADIWWFLRALHVLSLDLHSSTRQTEAHIKSMLALTATDGDPVASAGASWNELIVEASTAMVTSRSLRRDDLPAGTLARHGVIGTNERRVLQALADHTEPVLRAIRSTLGGNLHLPRAALVQKLLDSLENAQVVLVTGPAGCGKSAVGKDTVGVLALDHFLFGLRVEEFAHAHLDATLDAAQVPANWAKLRAILGAQDRKVVLVESVERLLEEDNARRVCRPHDAGGGRLRPAHSAHVPRLLGPTGAHELSAAASHQPHGCPRATARGYRAQGGGGRVSGARHCSQESGTARHPAQPLRSRQGDRHPMVLREVSSADRARLPRALLARDRARRRPCDARHGTAARGGAPDHCGAARAGALCPCSCDRLRYYRGRVAAAGLSHHVLRRQSVARGDRPRRARGLGDPAMARGAASF